MNTKLSTTNHIEAMWEHGATNHDSTPWPPDYLAEFRWSQRLKQSRGHVVLRYPNDNPHAVAWFSGTVTPTVRLTVAISYYFDIFTKLKGGGGGGGGVGKCSSTLQTRSGLTFLSLRYNKKWHKFIDTPSDKCLCNQGIEDTNHFLFLCPFFATQRATLATNVIAIFAETLHLKSEVGRSPFPSWDIYIYIYIVQCVARYW